MGVVVVVDIDKETNGSVSASASASTTACEDVEEAVDALEEPADEECTGLVGKDDEEGGEFVFVFVGRAPPIPVPIPEAYR